MITFVNPSTDPFYNQAFEEFVFDNFQEDEIFYLWQNRACVVVGSYQNICREVDVKALRRMRIPIVRRMTGGGTVYHDLGNINYTYIARQDCALDYDRCLAPVIGALNRMGVPARKNRSCDIAIGEQKISGSAQRTAGGRVLHHGTLLFQADLTALDRITMRAKNDAFQTKGTLSAICPVTNICDHLPRPMALEAFREQLLEQVLPRDCARRELSPEQEEAVCRLRDEKYRSWDWTWGRTPAFTYARDGLFDGAPIHVGYRARRGVLSEAAVDCAALDGAAAARMLNGSRLDPEAFMDICRALAGERAEALLDCLL